MEWSFKALGTTWWIEVFEDVNDKTRDEVQDFVTGFVTTYENNYSRFLPDSEISVLNRERILKNPNKETRELLGYSHDLYRRTRGVFNVMVGHILEARGYDGAYSFIDKGSAKLETGNPLTDLIINEDKIELRYGNVDIGGYGKGWLIDRLAEQLRDRFDLEQFLINGGGDMYATHQAGAPIEIHLQHPHTKEIVGSTMLKDQAFAASSPHVRSWPTRSGIEQNHIVSQTTEQTKDIIYLTAPNAADADAFATTLLQLDKDSAAKLVSQEHIEIVTL